VPVHTLNAIRAGTTTKLLLVWARDASTGAAREGLSADSSGASAAYVREGEGACSIPLRPGTPGSWTEGGFVEIDPARAPGVYQFGLPDHLLAEGATGALLVLRFDGAWIDPIKIELVAFDPQDEGSIGLAELRDDKRHAFLHQALPRLTGEELETGRRAEEELRARIGATRPSADADS
jgi:hypothetical protein